MGRVQRGEQRVRHYQQRAQRPRVKDFVLYAADLGLSAAIEWQPSAYSEHLVTALFATPVSYEYDRPTGGHHDQGFVTAFARASCIAVSAYCFAAPLLLRLAPASVSNGQRDSEAGGPCAD